jgi:hypothetical protein
MTALSVLATSPAVAHHQCYTTSQCDPNILVARRPDLMCQETYTLGFGPLTCAFALSSERKYVAQRLKGPPINSLISQHKLGL